MNQDTAPDTGTDQPEISPDNLKKAKEILRRHPAVDLHSHLGFWETKGIDRAPEPFGYRGDNAIEKNAEAMMDAGCNAVFLNLTSDITIMALGLPGNKTRNFQPGEAWAEYERQMDMLDEFFRILPLQKATRSTEAESKSGEEKLAVFLSTEGGHMVEDDPELLERIFDDGLRRFQPFHFAATRLGDNQTDTPRFGGLSPLGRDIIKKAAGLNMIMDLAHGSFEAGAQIADLTGAPLVFSHTMIKYDSKRFGSYLEGHPRLISREYARLIAQTNGVIGTWAVTPQVGGLKSMEAFVEAVLVMADTVGVDHVGWATDFIDAGMTYFADYRKFPILCAMLMDAGFSEDDLIKFVGGNALRVFKEVTGS